MHPEIFLNRISIDITDSIVPLDVVLDLLDDPLNVYTTRVTSYEEIRPIRGLSYALLTLRADTMTREERQQQPWNKRTPWTEMSLRVDGPEENMRFGVWVQNL
jgi:hypothetical protein